MKKIILSLAVALLVLGGGVTTTQAQIKMDILGKVQVGSIGQPQGLGVGRPQWEGALDVADGARIGNIHSRYHSGSKPMFGGSTTTQQYNFNPNGGWGGGLLIEQGSQRSSGFYTDRHYAVLWSPGVGGDLVKFAIYYNMKPGA